MYLRLCSNQTLCCLHILALFISISSPSGVVSAEVKFVAFLLDLFLPSAMFSAELLKHTVETRHADNTPLGCLHGHRSETMININHLCFWQ